MADVELTEASFTYEDLQLDYDLINDLYGMDMESVLIVKCTAVAVALLGVVANVMSMVIWTRVKSSFSILLVTVAACDLVASICSIVWFCRDTFFSNHSGTPAVDYTADFVLPFITICAYPVHAVAQTASSLLTLTIACELHAALRHPATQRTYATTCKYAFAVLIFSILYNILRVFEWKTVADVDLNTDATISYHIEPTELSRSPLYKIFNTIYSGWLHLTIIFIIPVTCIAVLNTAVYVELQRVKKRRMGLTYLQMKEHRRYRMLLYILLEFLVCSMLAIIDKIVYILHFQSGQQVGLNLMVLLPMSTFFDAINSSSNFVTYFVFGEEFRNAFVNLLRCRWGSDQPEHLSSAGTSTRRQMQGENKEEHQM